MLSLNHNEQPAPHTVSGALAPGSGQPHRGEFTVETGAWTIGALGEGVLVIGVLAGDDLKAGILGAGILGAGIFEVGVFEASATWPEVDFCPGDFAYIPVCRRTALPITGHSLTVP
jgi:hypothetical protein